VGVRLSLAIVAGAFLGLRLLGVLNFEPVTPAHLVLAAAFAPLAAAFRWGLQRLGW
jgi:hypothetical protein